MQDLYYLLKRVRTYCRTVKANDPVSSENAYTVQHNAQLPNKE